MPFVRMKFVKGRAYYYLVESHRVEGKPRQRVIAYLGEHQTVEAALAHWQGQAKTEKDAAAKQNAREMVSKLEPYLQS